MNKKQVWVMALAFIGMLCFFSCEKYYDEPKIIHNAVKDYDGNRYDAVKIGNQVWMLTNLRTTHYADGTPIAASISDDPIPGYYRIPGVDEATYGLLYNWYAAVRDTNNLTGKVQGICPQGWHVPNNEDWQKLLYFTTKYGNGLFEDCTGPARALASQTGWEYYAQWNMDDKLYPYCPGANPANNNESMFSAVPAGYCSMSWDSSYVEFDSINGIYDVTHYGDYSLKHFSMGSACFLWSVEEKEIFPMDGSSDPACGIFIFNSRYFSSFWSSSKRKGQSVRCVKD